MSTEDELDLLRFEVAMLRGTVEALEKKAKHWKANHDNQVQQKRQKIRELRDARAELHRLKYGFKNEHTR